MAVRARYAAPIWEEEAELGLRSFRSKSWELRVRWGRVVRGVCTLGLM